MIHRRGAENAEKTYKNLCELGVSAVNPTGKVKFVGQPGATFSQRDSLGPGMSKLPSSVPIGKTMKSVISADALHHGSSQHPDLAIYFPRRTLTARAFAKNTALTMSSGSYA
jgi:hypothetical protein